MTAGKMELRTGLLRSTTNVVPQAKLTEERSDQLKGDAVIWDVYGIAVAGSDGAKVTESTTELALDRVSGAAYDWPDAWVDEDNLGKGNAEKIKFVGHSYKLPFGTEKKDYPFWDAELRAANPIKFKGVEAVGGLEVYRFEQTIDLQKISMSDAAKGLVISTFTPGATGGDLYYSNTRTIWVEPVTGQFLNVREVRHQEFRSDTGVTKTLLDADFNYTQATIDKAVEGAGANSSKINLLKVYAPIGLGILGLLLLGFGLLLVARTPRTSRHGVDAA
ncbi:hypothetical protein F4553_003211 [Allocatelliglobosispora scoriae]|uniref:DUF3068 domain-containing protein n=1 Tax=Allocatelliglobosispora scoriae TaxID=643052 RepID=A0A841BSW5_9ACTN|nr:hypothetical protein [Allocatelliglobosispora scoriae]